MVSDLGMLCARVKAAAVGAFKPFSALPESLWPGDRGSQWTIRTCIAERDIGQAYIS